MARAHSADTRSYMRTAVALSMATYMPCRGILGCEVLDEVGGDLFQPLGPGDELVLLGELAGDGLLCFSSSAASSSRSSSSVSKFSLVSWSSGMRFS